MQNFLSIYELGRFGINQSKAEDLLELGHLKSWLIINGEAVKFNKLRDIPAQHEQGLLLNVKVDEEEIKQLPKVIAYLESKKPAVVAIDENPAAPYLDPRHKYYSKELAIAVKTWLALYAVDGKYSAIKSHKDQIRTVLAGHGLSSNMLEQITTVVNPNKKGGATATPETE